MLFYPSIKTSSWKDHYKVSILLWYWLCLNIISFFIYKDVDKHTSWQTFFFHYHYAILICYSSLISEQCSAVLPTRLMSVIKFACYSLPLGRNLSSRAFPILTLYSVHTHALYVLHASVRDGRSAVPCLTLGDDPLSRKGSLHCSSHVPERGSSFT